MMPGSGPWYLVLALVAVTALAAGLIAGLWMAWHGTRMARGRRKDRDDGS